MNILQWLCHYLHIDKRFQAVSSRVNCGGPDEVLLVFFENLMMLDHDSDSWWYVFMIRLWIQDHAGGGGGSRVLPPQRVCVIQKLFYQALEIRRNEKLKIVPPGTIRFSEWGTLYKAWSRREILNLEPPGIVFGGKVKKLHLDNFFFFFCGSQILHRRKSETMWIKREKEREK